MKAAGLPPGWEAFTERLGSARRIVALSGAGISAESGIPTFRDAMSGLWSRFSAEQLATPEAFERDPELVWGWYEWRRMQVMQTQPHAGHALLARWEAEGRLAAVVTQNVDDLHERAGSRHVIHVHGSLFAPRCFDCGAPRSLGQEPPQEPEGGRRLAPPTCTACGGRVRPGVVWFSEALPPDAWAAAEAEVEEADLLVVLGTSGLVYPAAGLPGQGRRAGSWVVQVNPQPTALDEVAHVNLRLTARVFGDLLAAPSEPTRQK